jgi:hypothetical protein
MKILFYTEKFFYRKYYLSFGQIIFYTETHLEDNIFYVKYNLAK